MFDSPHSEPVKPAPVAPLSAAGVTSLLPLSAEPPSLENAIVGALPPLPSGPRSNDAVRSRLQVDGFPELVLAWQQFEALSIDTDKINPIEVEKLRQKHMRYIGVPEVLGTALGATFGWAFARISLPLEDPLLSVVGAWTAANIGGLGGYAGMMLRRYALAPLKRAIGLETGQMLGAIDFRGQVEDGARAIELRAQLQSRGITAAWDDPTYCRQYRTEQGKVEAVEEISDAEITLRALRAVIGWKDRERRKHQPGRFATDVRGGKSTIAHFVSEHDELLKSAREGSLSAEQGARLLASLIEIVGPESGAERFLRSEISLLSGTSRLRPGVVQAEIWKRDPWVDLTHQEEFFSSASLRGVKLIGRGPKGRLGCFDYLHAPEFSCLDLRNDSGRKVRCRMLIAEARNASGGQVPVLFVDGVEGSNAIRPEVVDRALYDYALSCGVQGLVFNCTVHNQTPARFSRYISEQPGIQTGSVNIAALGSQAPMYLDSLGFPLEPFEYARPRGRVCATVKPISSEALEICTPLRSIDRAREFIRHNLLWCLVAESVLFSAVMTSMSEPRALIPLMLVAGGGSYLQLRHHRRADRQVPTLGVCDTGTDDDVPPTCPPKLSCPP